MPSQKQRCQKGRTAHTTQIIRYDVGKSGVVASDIQHLDADNRGVFLALTHQHPSSSTSTILPAIAAFLPFLRGRLLGRFLRLFPISGRGALRLGVFVVVLFMLGLMAGLGVLCRRCSWNGGGGSGGVGGALVEFRRGREFEADGEVAAGPGAMVGFSFVGSVEVVVVAVGVALDARARLGGGDASALFGVEELRDGVVDAAFAFFEHALDGGAVDDVGEGLGDRVDHPGEHIGRLGEFALLFALGLWRGNFGGDVGWPRVWPVKVSYGGVVLPSLFPAVSLRQPDPICLAYYEY